MQGNYNDFHSELLSVSSNCQQRGHMITLAAFDQLFLNLYDWMSLDGFHEMMHFHTSCICATVLHYVF